MASDINFVNYVIDQIRGSGDLRHKKMFGEYLIYCDNKPVVLVCDNTAFVKICDCVKKYLENADIGFPYKGAKEHYVLDVDNSELLSKVVNELAVNLPAPQLKKSKFKKL